MSAPKDVRKIAKGVAADIRQWGHYQGKAGQQLQRWDGEDGQCCVVINPTQRKARSAGHFNQLWEFEGYLLTGISTGTVTWNDSTPTRVVLATLDAIGAGEL